MAQLRKSLVRGSIDRQGLVAAYERFRTERRTAAGPTPVLRIDRRDESWELDSIEDFLDEYARGPCRAVLLDEVDDQLFAFSDQWGSAELTVRLAQPEQVRRVVETIAPPTSDPTFTIFIAHGRDPQWQTLASHLRDSHQFHVVSYESLAAYGQPAAEVLDLAAETASVALLVHTAELETTNGTRYPVPNVIHETGFFRARLGSRRALVLREDSCQSFTNIAGLTEIRFSDHNIREAFGDVVAELRQHDDKTTLFRRHGP